MADIPGHPKSPALTQWGLKLAVPVVGSLLALSAALAAACFVKAFGVTFLGRPRTLMASEAREVDRFSQVAMGLFAALCLLAGVLPGFVIDGLAPAVSELVGGRLPVQSALPWLTIIPIAAGQSSYNGLLVFLFITLSASIAAFIIHRWASHAVRRAPAWDCGYPDADPATQYTAGSFAQPIRQVFGTMVFHARERVEMPDPGQMLPARFHLDMRDLIWDVGYAPIAGAVAYVSERFNRMQFLTIRRYLNLVFLALVTLLLVLAIWL